MKTSTGAPLVSIVMAAYNHERYVGSAIDSLVAQTWPNLELIIVNDGSTDATFEVIQSRRAACAARFVRYEAFDQANAGVAAALNRGIEVAHSEYLYLPASDDISEPDAIATLVPLLVGDADVAVASGDCDFIDATGAKTSRTYLGVEHTSFFRFCTSHRDDVLGDKFGSYASLLVGNYIVPAVLLRRGAVLAVGSYDPQFAMEDYDLWLKLAKSYCFRFVDRVLCHYRWHGRNTISQNAERISYDELRLLAREAGYCFANGLGELWSARNRAALAYYRANWQRHHDMAALRVRSAREAEGEAANGERDRAVAAPKQTCAVLEKMISERDMALREPEKIQSSLLQRALKPVRAISYGLNWRR